MWPLPLLKYVDTLKQGKGVRLIDRSCFPLLSILIQSYPGDSSYILLFPRYHLYYAEAQSVLPKDTLKKNLVLCYNILIYIYGYKKVSFPVGNSLSFDCLFVWGFTPYVQHFSYSTATVHISMFPGLF